MTDVIRPNGASLQTIDTGTAYGRKRNRFDPLLTEVGPGTPMGELFRRYWHPIAVSADTNSDVPTRIRMLGEDLVLFRDKEGRPGLMVEHCCHRGTSLFYGRIEQDGIRCPYHGWKYDTEGHCLDQACEKDGGKVRHSIRQPWYPVRERYGVIWAYMGPPEKKPALPRWELLENPAEGEQFSYMYPSFGYGPKDALDFNWLQSFENTLDPMHAVWLHIAHSEENFFGGEPKYTPDMDTHRYIEHTSWSETAKGLRYEQIFPLGGGKGMYYSVENIMPNVSFIPNLPNPPNEHNTVNKIQWHVPVDDTHFKIFVIMRTGLNIRFPISEILKYTGLHKGKLWSDSSPEDLQRCPGDYETQSTQGSIAIHDDEHLVASDKGVVMTRRKLTSLINDVAAGKDPLNVSYDENADAWKTVAYAYIKPMP